MFLSFIDIALRKKAASSPYYDGNLFMEIVDMVPGIVQTTLEDFYNKDEGTACICQGALFSTLAFSAAQLGRCKQMFSGDREFER